MLAVVQQQRGVLRAPLQPGGEIVELGLRRPGARRVDRGDQRRSLTQGTHVGRELDRPVGGCLDAVGVPQHDAAVGGQDRRPLSATRMSAAIEVGHGDDLADVGLQHRLRRQQRRFEVLLDDVERRARAERAQRGGFRQHPVADVAQREPRLAGRHCDPAAVADERDVGVVDRHGDVATIRRRRPAVTACRGGGRRQRGQRREQRRDALHHFTRAR